MLIIAYRKCLEAVGEVCRFFNPIVCILMLLTFVLMVKKEAMMCSDI